MRDHDLAFALIQQVQSAMPEGGNEQDVRTYISRPMWQKFKRAIGAPENAEPTHWNGVSKTLRIYGSETVVVEDAKEWAVSVAMR